jgi:hypothetical protein
MENGDRPSHGPQRMLDNKIMFFTSDTLMIRKGASEEEHEPCALHCSGIVYLSQDRRIENSNGPSHGSQTNAGQ